ncbi:hypothetical protein [Streptomyces griseorubiginosus]|uniref:hypothetical protein n=1 Tax=Streptomyces griseorubiginosus TaxID=67304 RepID=UPI0036E34A35
MERTDQQHPTHDPCAWDDEDNKPVIPRIPRPRTPQVVTNFDNYGSFWGHDTVEETEAMLARVRGDGARVDEWDVTDRIGQPLRITRICDPSFLDTISVFSTEHLAVSA